jgi:hypothetical protein
MFSGGRLKFNTNIMRFKQFLITLFLIPVLASAQVINGLGDKIDSSKIKLWFPASNQEYQAVYHFGNSDQESQFILIIANNTCFAQIISGQWKLIDEGKTEWMYNYENLENVRIEGNKFYSDKTNGEFVVYENHTGLIVSKPWRGATRPGEQEIGEAICPVEKQFQGKYPFASYRFLNEDELQQMSKSDLQIMRNEIFARYGYFFNTGSEMNIYFKNQVWYSEVYPDVSGFLTGLEKENIELIKNVENYKNE